MQCPKSPDCVSSITQVESAVSGSLISLSRFRPVVRHPQLRANLRRAAPASIHLAASTRTASRFSWSAGVSPPPYAYPMRS